MSESLIIPESADRATLYESLLPQIESLISAETDLTANLANVTAVLREAFGFFWVGFYVVRGSELVLGPFQGSLACTRIAFGRGVCGSAWERDATVLVPDVEHFAGHIACSSLSRSEIVVPLRKSGSIVGVLDVDSDLVDDFSDVDRRYLEKLCNIIERLF